MLQVPEGPVRHLGRHGPPQDENLRADCCLLPDERKEQSSNNVL